MAENIRPEAAVRAAKEWLAQIYADEPIARISLEEVRFREGNWEITLGFNRLDQDEPESGPLKGITRDAVAPEADLQSAGGCWKR